MFASLRHRLASHGPWPRRAAAALCLVLAAVTASSPAHAPPAPTEPVVVAAGPLAAGRVLTATDLRVRRIPVAAVVPGSAAAPRTWLGRRLAGPVAAGEPITPLRTVGTELASGLPPGTVAAAVAVDDPRVGDWVARGSLVDVVVTAIPDGADSAGLSGVDPGIGGQDVGTPRPGSVLASGVRVLAVLADAPPTGAGGGDPTASPELVVAADRRTATALAVHRGLGPFTVLPRGG